MKVIDIIRNVMQILKFSGIKNLEERFYDFIIEVEGRKIVNEPDGTRSRYGIKESTLKELKKIAGLPENVTLETLTEDDAKKIMRYYFLKYAYEYNQLPTPHKFLIFDFIYNSGITNVRRTIPLNTIIQMNMEGVWELVMTPQQILDKRKEFYLKLVQKNPEKFSKFLNGWLNRLHKLAKYLQIDWV